jgi:hypothetical protein
MLASTDVQRRLGEAEIKSVEALNAVRGRSRTVRHAIRILKAEE